MSFEKYSTRSIEEKSYSLIEDAITLRRLAKNMVEETANGADDAFETTVIVASKKLEELQNKVTMLKQSFAVLGAALVGVELESEAKDGEVEFMVEQDENGIKFQ